MQNKTKKYIYLFIGILTLICNSCSGIKEKKFIYKHYKDNFSVFRDVNYMSYRGRNKDLSMIYVNIYSNCDNKGGISIYYDNISNSIISYESSNNIDTTYLDYVVSSFISLNIFEIQTDTSRNIIKINLEEDSNHIIYRLSSDSIYNNIKLDNKLIKIKNNWYLTK